MFWYPSCLKSCRLSFTINLFSLFKAHLLYISTILLLSKNKIKQFDLKLFNHCYLKSFSAVLVACRVIESYLQQGHESKVSLLWLFKSMFFCWKKIQTLKRAEIWIMAEFSKCTFPKSTGDNPFGPSEWQSSQAGSHSWGNSSMSVL